LFSCFYAISFCQSLAVSEYFGVKARQVLFSVLEVGFQFFYFLLFFHFGFDIFLEVLRAFDADFSFPLEGNS
jgi:hypothetical protein